MPTTDRSPLRYLPTNDYYTTDHLNELQMMISVKSKIFIICVYINVEIACILINVNDSCMMKFS